MQPNVLLIVLDTARADAFEPYGAAPGASPVIAELAGRGSAFPMMISTSSWTIPAHASLFTGLLPRAVGFAPALWTVPDLRTVVPAAMSAHADRILPEVLRRNGYATRALSTNPMIRGPHGFGTGFDRFSEARNVRAMTLEVLREKFDRLRASKGLNARRRVQRAKELVHWWRAVDDNGAARAGRTVREWIARREAGRPFFWFVNLIETHNPYFPPKPYNDYSGAERWRAMDDVFRYESFLEVVLTNKGDLDIPEDALRRMRHLYARSVNYLDDWIRGVLEELDAVGLLDDTLVMVTSDHGESFYENHLVNHGWSVDQRQVHVPFVVAGPGAPEPRPLASLAEVPRMVADAAGIADHPYRDDPLYDGVAIAQKDVTFQGRDEIFSRARLRGISEGDLLAFMARTMSCATDGTFKLVRTGEREELFHLGNDPAEATDVTAEHPDHVRSLRAALDAAAGAEAPVPVRPGGRAVPEIAAEEEAEIEAQLEGLGYI